MPSQHKYNASTKEFISPPGGSANTVYHIIFKVPEGIALFSAYGQFEGNFTAVKTSTYDELPEGVIKDAFLIYTDMGGNRVMHRKYDMLALNQSTKFSFSADLMGIVVIGTSVDLQLYTPLSANQVAVSALLVTE